MCHHSNEVDGDSICTFPENCPSFKASIDSANNPDICTFVGFVPIVCCPITEIKETKNVVEMSTVNIRLQDKTVNKINIAPISTYML